MFLRLLRKLNQMAAGQDRTGQKTDNGGTECDDWILIYRRTDLCSPALETLPTVKMIQYYDFRYPIIVILPSRDENEGLRYLRSHSQAIVPCPTYLDS